MSGNFLLFASDYTTITLAGEIKMGSQTGQSVCVIGAGIMGIMTAYYLMKSGRCSHITLLEEGDVAGGASGKAAGFLARDWHGAPTAVSLSDSDRFRGLR
jgi:glycine/D-amino acid oxidase-like deaminating enzyme